jgi:hypothetical protein
MFDWKVGIFNLRGKRKIIYWYRHNRFYIEIVKQRNKNVNVLISDQLTGIQLPFPRREFFFKTKNRTNDLYY